MSMTEEQDQMILDDNEAEDKEEDVIIKSKLSTIT
jgi:hypothetical protein